MHDIEINDGQFKLKCLEFSEEFFNDYIRLNLIFKRIPDILLKFGTAGVIIDKIQVYDELWVKYKKYIPFYRSSIIVTIKNSDFRCHVRMKTLKTEFASCDIVKNCAGSNCNRKINYTQVMCSLIDIVKDEETAENIWNSELVEFLCCFCFVYRFKK